VEKLENNKYFQVLKMSLNLTKPGNVLERILPVTKWVDQTARRGEEEAVP